VTTKANAESGGFLYEDYEGSHPEIWGGYLGLTRAGEINEADLRSFALSMGAAYEDISTISSLGEWLQNNYTGMKFKLDTGKIGFE